MNAIVQAEKVLQFFHDISQIPRESGHEKELSDYIVQFAKDRNLEVSQDEAWNVVIKKPASAGYEDRPTVILQGHIDMVCEKTHESNHDFRKDPIANIIDGEWLHADGTTLGADNGMGVCMAMAILDDGTLAHPALEVLCTTSEETGMNGASAIKPGQVTGKYLLNLDTEVEHEFIVSCAGGCHVIVNIPLLRENTLPGFNAGLTITVSGLLGGHSGLEINKQRGNSNQILARVLYALGKQYSFTLSNFTGGTKHNAIPNKSVATLAVRTEDVEAIKNLIAHYESTFQHEFAAQDPGLTITVDGTDVPDVVYADDTTEALISYLYLAEDGVHTVSKSIENLVETSNNLAVVKEDSHALSILVSVRSSSKNGLDYLTTKMLLLADTLGVSARKTDGYPAWEYEQGSALEEQALTLYKKMSPVEPTVNAVHAGLECGLLKGALPDTQMISFGPTITGAHTPQEKCHLPSVENVYIYLKELLKELH